MGAFIYVIGSFVFTVFMYCVPIMATLSIVLNWYGSIKLICIVCVFTQFIFLWCKVYEEANTK